MEVQIAAIASTAVAIVIYAIIRLINKSNKVKSDLQYSYINNYSPLLTKYHNEELKYLRSTINDGDIRRMENTFENVKTLFFKEYGYFFPLALIESKNRDVWFHPHTDILFTRVDDPTLPDGECFKLLKSRMSEIGDSETYNYTLKRNHPTKEQSPLRINL